MKTFYKFFKEVFYLFVLFFLLQSCVSRAQIQGENNEVQSEGKSSLGEEESVEMVDGKTKPSQKFSVNNDKEADKQGIKYECDVPYNPGPEVYSKMNPSIVSIIARGYQKDDVRIGSGFIYQKKYVATNHHLVDGAKEIFMEFHDESILGIKSFVVDSDYDIALILPALGDKAKKLDYPDLELCKKCPPIVQTIYMVSYPLGMGRAFLSGLISNPDSTGTHINGNKYSHVYTLSGDFNPGSRSGAIVNNKAKMIGLIIPTEFNLKTKDYIHALKINRVNEVLKKLLHTIERGE